MARKLEAVGSAVLSIEEVATMFARADTMRALNTAWVMGVYCGDAATEVMSQTAYANRIAEHNLAIRGMGRGYNRPLRDTTELLWV